MNPIPTKQREIMHSRAQGRCERCGGRGTEAHHRRPRNVKDEHQHCGGCNLVWLCSTCHRWAHGHPEMAREEGVIVRRSVSEPFRVPFLHWTGNWALNRCDGSVMFSLKRDRAEVFAEFHALLSVVE